MHLLRKLLIGFAFLYAGCASVSKERALESLFEASASSAMYLDVDPPVSPISIEYHTQKGSDYFLLMMKVEAKAATLHSTIARIEKTKKYNRSCILDFGPLSPAIYDTNCDAIAESIILDGFTERFKDKEVSELREKANKILAAFYAKYDINGKLEEFLKYPDAAVKKSKHLFEDSPEGKEKAREKLDKIFEEIIKE